MDAEQNELERLRLELARAQGHIEELRTQLEVHSLEPTELREIVQNLEQQLVERDEELGKLREALDEGDVWRRDVEAANRRAEEARRDAEHEVEALREELEEIKSTRLWRIGQRYWEAKARLRAGLRRGSP